MEKVNALGTITSTILKMIPAVTLELDVLQAVVAVNILEPPIAAIPRGNALITTESIIPKRVHVVILADLLEVAAAAT